MIHLAVLLTVICPAKPNMLDPYIQSFKISFKHTYPSTLTEITSCKRKKIKYLLSDSRF